ncbi:type VII secretion protein EsaA [Metabacillus arenae]|uniref:Type VII secretion protein EsaA n=1 Tax=Metabacillus arenae TaxID=2771434 RepID=A0A926NFB9_9BACI|nr:type VII secretion protein EsaA [Metabacillus arenae]MBD1379770.1 type VII secretion protein EsaA [Metabacillus arenae]
MKEQRINIVKMIAAVLLILAVPTLFFQLVGDNPMEVREIATRSIAVVNEDIGSEQVMAENTEEGGEDSSQFGKEVAKILGEESDYQWTVMGRSAADNGLQNQKYDAVIYIPSDFSQNILTYDEQQPQKANFEYKIQGQLNSVNREKVLRELEDATNRVDKEMSSLYWSYVSNDMKAVRQEFDRILEKEIAFQNAMVSFYQPSSKDLAGEIEQHKQRLEQLRASMQQGEEGAPERKDSLEQFEQNLTQFVQYVEEYQEYQERQKELLQKAQDESILAIQSGTEDFLEMQRQTIKDMNDQGNQIAGDVKDIRQMLNNNSETIADLSIVRLKQIDRQEEELKAVHAGFIDLYEQEDNKKSLDNLQTTIITLKNDISTGNGGDDEQLEKEEPVKIEEPVNGDIIDGPEGVEPPGSISMEDERQKLRETSDKINSLHNTLSEQLNEEQQDKVKDVLEELIGVSNSIIAIENTIKEKEDNNTLKAEYGKLFKQYEDLIGQYNQLVGINQTNNNTITDLLDKNNKLVEKYNVLVEKMEASSNDEVEILSQINSLEESILSSDALSHNRRDDLSPIFGTEVFYSSENIKEIMEYYGKLSEMNSILNSILDVRHNGNPIKDTVMQDNFLNNDIKTILSLTKEEQGAWDDLMKEEVPATQEELKTMQDNFMAFMDQYNKDLEGLQTSSMEDLDAMQESANTVLNQIQNPAQSTGVEAPRPNVEDGTLVSSQENISQEVLQLNELMKSLSETQDNVVDYTGELQQQVNNVQEDADTLNEKWATNVASTKLVREDVFSVLGNTFVDGQNNGAVYEHLANPLQISGEAPAEAAKKIPPVVILVIILLSSLLIGFFSHYFNAAPLLVRGSLFGLLNLIVGMIISLFGLNIYTLSDERAIQWSIFTVLLLLASSTLVRVALTFGNMIGWIASIGLVAFFISPLLAQAAPNFNYEDPMSLVYLSLQYETNTLFTQGVLVTAGIIVVLSALPFVSQAFKNAGIEKDSDEVHEI